MHTELIPIERMETKILLLRSQKVLLDCDLAARFATHDGLARKLDELVRKHDEPFCGLFEALRQLMNPPAPPRLKIGLEAREDKGMHPA